jgi:hypothetical protein
MRRGAAAVLLVLALGVAAGLGCAHDSNREQLDRLKESVEGYNHAFRWKNYERAAAFLPSDLRGPFAAAYEDDDTSLQIEDYQIVAVNMHDDNAAADVTVKVRYMLLPAVTIQHSILKQHWHKVSGEWLLETEDDSIRPLDLAKKPSDPRILRTSAADAAHEGDTQIKATKPGEKEKEEPEFLPSGSP